MVARGTTEDSVRRSPAPAAKVRGLRKRYGDVVALAGLDLDLHAGSVLGLMGPNGAGKTTAARCIAGLLTPDAGEVRIAPAADRRRTALAIATQEIELYPGLPVETNLAYFARLSGVPQVDRVVAEVAAELGLESMLRSAPRTLSIGQQRLVHVGTALVALPQVLLLDEPTAGLDVGARTAVLEAVVRRRDQGVAVLLSSHQLRDIETTCDRAVLVNEGQVVVSGEVDSLIARHSTTRIEVTVDGTVQVIDGDDVPAAIAQATAGGGQIDAVNVVKPSLEAVFVSLTGAAGSALRAEPDHAEQGA